MSISLYFSIEISTFSLLFYWNLYFLFANLYFLIIRLKSLPSLDFAIEISTFFLLSIEISTSSMLSYWNLYFLIN